MPFPQTIGGGTTHIVNLGKALVNLGNEVHIISSRAEKGKENQNARKFPKGLYIHQIGMIHKKFEGSGKFYYLYRIFFELAFLFGAWKKIKEIKPDVIDTQAPITTSLPASLSGVPFVMTCHGIHSYGFGKFYKMKGKKLVGGLGNKIYYTMAKFNSKRARKIISQGDETVDFYVKLAGDKKKKVIIPNLVDTEFWEFSNDKDNKRIATAARFSKQKALDKLVTAMKSLSDYELHLIGGGDMEEVIKKIAGKNVKLFGFQPPEFCKKEYKKARFTVLPSEFEGLPYSILESMSSGVIPIVTKVGDLRSLIVDGKNGFFLKDNNPKTIIETIKKASKANLKKIGIEARKTVVNGWGLDKVGRIFLNIYKQALEEKG